MDEQLRSLIMTKAAAGDLRRYAMAKGMVTLREDAWAKVCEGITTVEEILRVTQEEVFHVTERGRAERSRVAPQLRRLDVEPGAGVEPATY